MNPAEQPTAQGPQRVAPAFAPPVTHGTAASTTALHLHIDRIVVDGLPAGSQRRFVRALEQQISEAAASLPLAAMTSRRLRTLHAGTLRPGSTPEQAAAQVVRRLMQSLSATGESSRGEGGATR